MMDISLSEFLIKVSQELPWLTYISTRNSSFPKEYRFNKIFSWDLEDRVSDDILNKKVKSINGSRDILYNIMGNRFKYNNLPVKIEIELY